MASLKDVAALAGVSVTTVSRVLNNYTLVEPGTRIRVETAIEKLGYRPNLLAAGLRAGSSKLIGLVVPETAHTTFSCFTQYIGDYCCANGYDLIVGSHYDNPIAEEKLIDTYYRRNIDGLILSLVSDESRVLGMIEQSKVPTVVLDRVIKKSKHASVTVNNYKAGELMARHFLSLGYKKIGCVTGRMSISLSRERLQGFRETLAQFGVLLDDRFIAEGDFRYEAGLVAGEKLFRDTANYPDAVWAQNDLMAAGIIKYAGGLGLAAPRNFAIAGMDDIELAKIITPSLTTIVQPIKQMSKNAVDLIIQFRGNAVSSGSVMLDPQLVIRESTGSPGLYRSN